MRFSFVFWLALALVVLPGPQAMASGVGANVIVIVNQQRSNSIALGNYYSELRQVPPQNVLRMSNWNGGAVSWTLQEFTINLLNPLRGAIQSRGLTNQADFVLLSMDIPYRVEDGQHANSTTAALYYGFKTNGASPVTGVPSCSLPSASSNAFAGSESPFRSTRPGSLSWSNLMTVMITGSDLATAKLAVSQGALSDSTFPTAHAVLAKSTDRDRNIRYALFDTAVFDSRVQGERLVDRTNANGLEFGGTVSGAQTGYYSYNPFATTFTPGALVDNLTSYGGTLFEYNAGQITALHILAAGASGSYGTVIEPCAYLEKFPIPEVFFYQSRGFSLAECYYMGVTNPFQGLILGDPLAAPFAAKPVATWTAMPMDPLSGMATLNLQAQPANPSHPVSRVDLFVDGTWFQTLTNISPASGNVVSAIINGVSASYTVPSSASLNSVASGLAAALNAKTSQTRTRATAIGDRVELCRTILTTSSSQVPVSVSTTRGSAAALTTFAEAAQPTFLETIAHGIRGYQFTGNPTNRWLSFTITKTNGTVVTIGATNTTTWNLEQLGQQLLSAINTKAELTGADGVVAEDLVRNGTGTVIAFNLRARTPGWNEAQIYADFNAASGLTISPTTKLHLDENLHDLEPRNHLYLNAGAVHVPLMFSLDTTKLSDGFHQLSAVATEGSNARAQSWSSANIQVRNGQVTGSLETVVGGTNAALEGTLEFKVTGTGASISKVELFTTGGQFASASQASATFQVPSQFLGPGLHPFYAVITATSGQQYRTATEWIRILDYEPAFAISTSPDGLLCWPSTAGRTYNVLSTTNLDMAFQSIGTVTATNTVTCWQVSPDTAQRRFYKVEAEL